MKQEFERRLARIKAQQQPPRRQHVICRTGDDRDAVIRASEAEQSRMIEAGEAVPTDDFVHIITTYESKIDKPTKTYAIGGAR